MANLYALCIAKCIIFNIVHACRVKIQINITFKFSKVVLCKSQKLAHLCYSEQYYARDCRNKFSHFT